MTTLTRSIILLVSLFLIGFGFTGSEVHETRTYEVVSISETDLIADEVGTDEGVYLYLSELDFDPLLGDVIVVNYGQYEDEILSVIKK